MREQLYSKLTTELQRQLPGSTKPQTKNLALLTQALVFSPNCHVNNLALELPIAGRQDSLINRLRRFPDNCHVTRYHHYFPLVRSMFAYWPDKEVGLVMDRTDIDRDKSILLLGAAFKHRVVDLASFALWGNGSGVTRELVAGNQALSTPRKAGCILWRQRISSGRGATVLSATKMGLVSRRQIRHTLSSRGRAVASA